MKKSTLCQNKTFFENINKLHITPMGIERVKRNLRLTNEDVVNWCQKNIREKPTIINQKGKNWYVSIEDYTLTINAQSYTIITAHKIGSKKSV